jgi:hypothetical protein
MFWSENLLQQLLKKTIILGDQQSHALPPGVWPTPSRSQPLGRFRAGTDPAPTVTASAAGERKNSLAGELARYDIDLDRVDQTS